MFGIKFPAIIYCVILVVLLVINGAGKLSFKLITVLLINFTSIVLFLFIGLWFDNSSDLGGENLWPQ